MSHEAEPGQLEERDGASTPTAVVERFLELLRSGDADGATQLLARNVEYTNVSLPTVHGRERVGRLLRAGYDRGGGFDVYLRAISATGPSVLTERIDVLTFRGLRVQLWVCGRFDVRSGQIVLWRDYFDWLNLSVAIMRGLLGVVLPLARAKPPAGV